MLTSIDLPDDLLLQIDDLIARRKALQALPHQSNDAEKLHAKHLAQTEGIESANRYLKSLRPKLQASRGGVLCDLARVALCMIPPEAFNLQDSGAGLPPPRSPRQVSRVYRINK